MQLRALLLSDLKVHMLIKMMEEPLFDKQTHQDDIILECHVEDSQFCKVLRRLEQKRLTGVQLLLGFCASYNHFDFHYAGRDPKHMLNIHCELTDMRGWFDGKEWVNLNDYLLKEHFEETAHG